MWSHEVCLKEFRKCSKFSNRKRSTKKIESFVLFVLKSPDSPNFRYRVSGGQKLFGIVTGRQNFHLLRS